MLRPDMVPNGFDLALFIFLSCRPFIYFNEKFDMMLFEGRNRFLPCVHRYQPVFIGVIAENVAKINEKFDKDETKVQYISKNS